MKTKLNLSLDDLAVESFATHGEARAPRGTVQGHMAWGTDNDVSDFGDCGSWGCGDDRSGPSHAPSCGVTCQITGYNYCFENPCRQDW